MFSQSPHYKELLNMFLDIITLDQLKKKLVESHVDSCTYMHRKNHA